MSVPPHSIEADRHVIGRAVTTAGDRTDLASIVTVEDFYSHDHQAIWASLTDLHAQGIGVDASTLAESLRTKITDPRATLADCITAVISGQAARTLAHTVADYSATRRIQGALGSVLQGIEDNPAIDPAVITDQLTADMDGLVTTRSFAEIDGLYTDDAILHSEFPMPPEIFPGFLRELDRVLLVGVEGSGKSVLSYQWAAQAAAGRHPFTARPCEPVSALIVDCENPIHRVKKGLSILPQRTDEWGPLHIWSQPTGINIRSRVDRAKLHAVCERTRPKVIAIGPLYKLHRSEVGETDEEAALRCQNILDDLRSRFDCALIIEHHAPKGSDSFRKLIPFGSSAWMRWPEFGWTLVPHTPNTTNGMGNDSEGGRSLRLGNFRAGDRNEIDKPARFDRSMGWPWAAYWPDSMPDPTPPPF